MSSFLKKSFKKKKKSSLSTSNQVYLCTYKLFVATQDVSACVACVP